ncbi:uncharacterized protein ARMOST_06429 [Armillaria ostoyae]|uniref:Uncharacterized protein n=1 Tax=Armillaria ostoyae TaxID=47428 RepID=A0A284R2Y9_ARMOS|nr:uncharacterized protein ARMOST_06429 [Armillaria ostoyae]
MYSTFWLYMHIPVFPSTTTSSILPAAISTLNTSSTLPMDGRPISSRRCGKRSFSRGHMTAQRAGTGLDDGASDNRWDYLTKQPPDPARLTERPHAQFMFGGGNAIGTLSFVDAAGGADDNQVKF